MSDVETPLDLHYNDFGLLHYYIVVSSLVLSKYSRRLATARSPCHRQLWKLTGKHVRLDQPAMVVETPSAKLARVHVEAANDPVWLASLPRALDTATIAKFIPKETTSRTERR